MSYEPGFDTPRVDGVLRAGFSARRDHKRSDFIRAILFIITAASRNMDSRSKEHPINRLTLKSQFWPAQFYMN